MELETIKKVLHNNQYKDTQVTTKPNRKDFQSKNTQEKIRNRKNRLRLYNPDKKQ
jgi:hypothetical protein